MAKMQRPCWTIAFAFICVLVVPGAVLTHMSVAKLIPEISDLPTNIATGFDQVFKFAYLEQDSLKVKTVSATALKQCAVTDAAVTCPTNPQPDPSNVAQQGDMSAAAAKADILKAFATSLSVVGKIANDKYFGTADMKNTADNLNKITAEMEKLKGTMKCYEAIPTFCGIYVSADGIVGGIATVNKAIDGFKKSDIVKRGGVCCCCRDGTKCGTLAVIPSILLWLVSFTIYVVVLAIGVLVKFFAKNIPVPVLVGKPTLDIAIKHIQTNYSEFWNVVFAGMETGLDLLLLASYFFVAAALLQFIYSSLECCCCPYRKKASAENKAAQPEVQPEVQKSVEEAPVESTV